MPTAEWCAEAERDVSQFTGDSSIHRGTSHFHRRFRNDFWCQRGTGSLLLHLFARFVCQFWYTYYIILLIYIYIYIHLSQSSLAAFFGEVYEYRGNFMGQFLRAGLQNTHSYSFYGRVGQRRFRFSVYPGYPSRRWEHR